MAVAAIVGAAASDARGDQDGSPGEQEGSPGEQDKDPLPPDERNAYTKHDWPVQPILRPLTLAPRMREISGETFLINLSSGRIAEPISLAPNIRAGITRRFEIGIIHDLGICISTNGCGTAYNDVGLEAAYSLLRASAVQAVARVGIQAPRFSRFYLGARAGMTIRLRLWPVALVLSPTLYAGMVGRGEAPDEMLPIDAAGRADVIEAPVVAQVQLGSRGLALLSSGIFGSVSGFGDDYRIPLGIGALFAINHKVDLGLAWRFDDLLGPSGSIDFRTLIIRAALRF